MSRSPCPRSLGDSLWLRSRHVVYRAPTESNNGQVGWGETSRSQPWGWMEHWAWRAGDWESSHQLALPLLCRLSRIKPRDIKTTIFLILVHRLIFPKSVMMSESLPNASPAASQTEVKVPLCLNSRDFIQATVCLVVLRRAPHVWPCGWRESQSTNR